MMYANVAAQACLGLGGAAVYASNKLWTGLCAGDVPPSPQAKARTWGQFTTSLLAGTLFAATMTDWVVGGWLHGHAPWPAVSVTIGLFGNALWPLALSATGDGLRDRIRAWLGASSNGGKT